MFMCVNVRHRFPMTECLEVRQSDFYYQLLAVRQSHNNQYNHADRLRCVLPAVFVQYTVKIKDRNMFSQAPFVAD